MPTYSMKFFLVWSTTIVLIVGGAFLYDYIRNRRGR